MTDSQPEFLTAQEVAELTRVPLATLRYWRNRGLGPVSFKMGPRRIVYARADVLAWVEAQRIPTTSGELR